MAHRIVWSSRAAQDLDSIIDYIAADSPAYAGTVLKNILNQTRVLARFPQLGRKVPEFDGRMSANSWYTATGLFADCCRTRR